MIILASQSPRRKEILNFFSLPFEQKPSDFDERSISFEGDPVKYVHTLAKGKAAVLARAHPDEVILAADTIVFHEGEIFNKPEGEEECFEMLKKLNGSWHTVYTAVCAQKNEEIYTLHEQTNILFHHLSEKQLEKYHKAFGSLDKAAGYGVQEGGSLIVKRIEGCFYNVMGLPVGATRLALEKLGIDLWEVLC